MSTQLSLFDEGLNDEKPAKSTAADLEVTYSTYWWSGYYMMREYMESVRVSKNRLNIKYLDKVPDGLEKAYQDCYDGSSLRLDNHANRQESKFMAAYSTYRTNCDKCGMEALSLDELVSNFWSDASRRRSVRDKCERRAKNPMGYPLLSLKEL